MVRILVLAAFVSIFLIADPVDDKIISLIGKKEYAVQKKLIGIIFKKRENYYINSEKVDTIGIIQKLKKNGLIDLFFNSPKNLKVTFSTIGDSLFFIKTVGDSLSSMGYRHFLTKELIKNGQEVQWSILLNTEYIIDPIFFSNELKKRGCFVSDISKISETYWRYDIDTQNIKLLAQRIELDSTTKLKKPIKPYWINVENALRLKLKSHRIDHWFPYIVFYDKNMNIVSYYEDKNMQKSLKLSIPQEAKYVKIDDIYTLDNIKRGLSIYLFSD